MKLYLLIGLFISLKLSAQNNNKIPILNNEAIRLNQIGYYPESPKMFVFAGNSAQNYNIINADGRIVYKGTLKPTTTWDKSGEELQTGDFSLLQTPGKYFILLNNKIQSLSFEIKPNIYLDLSYASVKAFYYQRASMPIIAKFAGKYHRVAGHPDTACYYHSSTGHKFGKKASPRGWYDAGDYNKYVVSAGVSMGLLMQLHELFPNWLADGSLNIPESGNGVNDLLDEIHFELDWLISMQDIDGGVFCKVTNLIHDPFIMPDKAIERRYIVGKSTGSTLCFAAIMAQASRIFKPINQGFAGFLLQASERAWQWAVSHPNIEFKNPPDVKTGEYGESNFRNDFFWAASELYVTTSKPLYVQALFKYTQPFNYYYGNWRNFISTLGYFSLLSDECQLSAIEKGKIKTRLFFVGDSLIGNIKKEPYRIPIDNFNWGSNSDMLDAAIVLAMAYKYSSDKKYLNAALETTDYIFGKNATTYCFVTGFGSKSPKNPHHRLSAADGLNDPIPGFLVGGPNKNRNDEPNIKYINLEPARSYIDNSGSFASNEVAINWNAPLAFITGFFENSFGKK